MADEKMVKVEGELPESLFNALVDLANKRGVTANTVLQEAIVSEKFIAEQEEKGGKILLEDRDHKISRLVWR